MWIPGMEIPYKHHRYFDIPGRQGECRKYSKEFPWSADYTDRANHFNDHESFYRGMRVKMKTYLITGKILEIGAAT